MSTLNLEGKTIRVGAKVLDKRIFPFETHVLEITLCEWEGGANGISS